MKPGCRCGRSPPRWLPRPGHQGFTLLELMMATLVLGILMAIAVVTYSSYRDRVNVVKAIADLRLMEASIAQFMLDNRRLPTDITEAGYSYLRDPWGRPYVYYAPPPHNLGFVRKDRLLNPVNTDYDLYSKGKDGLTQLQLSNRVSLDDIVRANNGAFMGKAADF